MASTTSSTPFMPGMGALAGNAARKRRGAPWRPRLVSAARRSRRPVAFHRQTVRLPVPDSDCVNVGSLRGKLGTVLGAAVHGRDRLAPPARRSSAIPSDGRIPRATVAGRPGVLLRVQGQILLRVQGQDRSHAHLRRLQVDVPRRDRLPLRKQRRGNRWVQMTHWRGGIVHGPHALHGRRLQSGRPPPPRRPQRGASRSTASRPSPPQTRR